MINEILEAISIRLHENFQHCKVYIEDVKQGFCEPCFFVSSINTSIQPYIGTRKKHNNFFSVQYFPSHDSEKRKECQNVGEELLELLTIVERKGSKYRGTGMEFRVEDEVLVFVVNYNAITYRPSNNPYMGGLTSDIGKKG